MIIDNPYITALHRVTPRVTPLANKATFKAALVVVGLLALTACTTLSGGPAESEPATAQNESDSQAEQQRQSEEPDAVMELAVDQFANAYPDDSLDASSDAPKLELTAELLEQILVLNLASYQGDWATGSKQALAAAETSQDYRVARVATLLALRDHNYEVAAKGAKLWVELEEDSPDAANMQILAQVGAGQIDEAMDSLANHAEGKTLDKHIKQMAGLLVRQQNGDAAHEIASKYAEQHSQSAQALLSSAFIAESFEHFDSASEWIERALILRPDWDLAAQMKAGLLRRQGKTEERSEFIAEFVDQYPTSTTMRINHAAELAREQRYDEALELMQAVLVDAPQDIAALSYAGALAQQVGDLELAKDYYQKALREDPGNDNVRWSLARLAVVQEKYAVAEQLYNDISTAESYIGAQIQVANMRYYTSGLTEAINTLRGLEPTTEAEYIEIALTRHYLLMQDHQYDDALGYINETLLYLPENLDLIYARALVASELKRLDIAEKDFRFIIAKQPTHANALNALGYTLADQTDRFEEAKELISKALELRPEDAHILDSMGWVLYRMNDFEGAIEYLEKAFAASPEVEIAAHLGEVLWESGEQERANQVWQTSFANDSDNPILNKTLERYGVEYSAQANK